MEGRPKEKGRRASMYDPARDIFSQEQKREREREQEEHGSSAEHKDNPGHSTAIAAPSPAPATASQSVERAPSAQSWDTPLSAEPIEHQSKVTSRQTEAFHQNHRPPKSHSRSTTLHPSVLPSSHTAQGPLRPRKATSAIGQMEPSQSEKNSTLQPSPGKKRKATENEPAVDAASQQDRQHQQLSKRRRREDRHYKAPKREAPSAYSRRDRSPQARRRESRSGSRDRRATEYRRSRSPLPHERSVTPEAQARQRKRPGGGARLGTAGKDVLRRRQEERELAQQREVEQDLRDRGVSDVVRQHYNAVPERGREWRKTDSKIKGLRSFNNWIKSTVIQKFSPDEDFLAHKTGTKEWAAEAGGSPSGGERKKLLVVDLGCGKGGDLGKWQQAPQPVDLYVGLDPAEVSIDQARDRYNAMRNNRNQRNRRGNALFHAEFHPKDCFGEWLGDLRIIQEVGIDANVGPGANLMHARWGGGGFDVVVSMFTMHYAFESEQKARQMLQNVAGALKKGGRFIGVGPNSDVISAKVAEFHQKHKAQKEKSLSSLSKEQGEEGQEEAPEDGEVEDELIPEWGNSIYRVRFPGTTPHDGVFRPPFGWKYSYFMEEAVEEIPEYVVPWEAFRYLTTEYNLELIYRRPFLEIWNEEKDDPELGPLSERMGVRGRGGGELLVSDEELEAASFYHAFVFQKI